MTGNRRILAERSHLSCGQRHIECQAPRGPDEYTEEMSEMKTMTCRQLGGPCDLRLRGETADDVIKAQDRHLRETVKAADASHEAAHREMKGRWKHPVAGMGWYRQVKRDFAGLPAS